MVIDHGDAWLRRLADSVFDKIAVQYAIASCNGLDDAGFCDGDSEFGIIELSFRGWIRAVQRVVDLVFINQFA